MKNKSWLLPIILVLIYGCAQIVSPPKNNPPEARFSINPKIGTTETEFILDASFSSDDKDSVQNLNYFWEYYSRYGRKIDTAFGIIDTAIFPDTGLHIIDLTVYDSDSLFGSTSDTIQVHEYKIGELVIPDSCLNFGPVEVGFTVSENLALKNIGNDTLQISAVYFTGRDKAAFTSNYEPGLKILPDSTKNIIVDFAPQDTGTYEARININSNSNQEETKRSLALSGHAFSDLYDIEIVNVEDDSIGFGQVEANTDSTFTINLKNKGAEPREIMAAYIVGKDKDAFKCDFSSEFIIPAGSTKGLDVSFAPEDTMQYIATLVIKSDDQFSKKKEIALQGKGYKNVPIVKIDDGVNNNLDFGKVEVGLELTKSVEIFNQGATELNITAVYVTGGGSRCFSTGFDSEFSIQPEQSQMVDITFQPDSDLVFNSKLVILSNGISSSKREISLTGQGVKNKLEIFDPADKELAFGEVEVGRDSTKFVEIKNIGAQTKEVIAAYITGEYKNNFSCDFASEIVIEPDNKQRIFVSYSPLDTLDHNANLVIKTNESVDNKKIIALTGRGYENTPEISIDNLENNSLNFGYVLIDSDSTKNVKVHNRGELALDIFTVYFTGPDKALFRSNSENEFSIPPGQSNNINVTYSPVSNEQLEATYLNIVSSDPDSAIRKIRLSGQGTYPAEVDCQDTLAFGAIKLTENKQKNLRIKNMGQGPLLNLQVIIISQDFDAQYSQKIDLAPGVATNIPIIFNPVSAGEKVATLVLSSDNHGDFKVVVLTGTANTN